ncbi:hypothetical protein PsorP6_017084 [Peronosclerospora sorghi]|uniref:Uncharacterized protein n=1 Tax=Peronosclerospora sorghi TaxID=230839 RepID=A0ACC0WFP4_9STRA|nr:hypothetical protein PsorP6_017084 [Peronosclerospora sorghi]
MRLHSSRYPFLLYLTIETSGLEYLVQASSECCSTCIGKPSPRGYAYDPVIFEQCSTATDGVCCFDCGTLGDPTYGDTVSYGDNGVTPMATTSTAISFTWPGVVNVTYVSLKTGQKKTITPTFTAPAATTMQNGVFVICATSPGTIYLRGWGATPCRQASTEHAITIQQGTSSTRGTCNKDTDIVSDATSSRAKDASAHSRAGARDDTVATCNLERASVTTVDGVSTCVCVSEWTHPPACDRWPAWKWLVTAIGGLATLFSIALSVRAFWHRRYQQQAETDTILARKKQPDGAEYHENLAPMGTKSDVGPLDFTPATRFHDGGTALTPPKPTEFSPGGTRKPDERLFSL